MLWIRPRLRRRDGLPDLLAGTPHLRRLLPVAEDHEGDLVDVDGEEVELALGSPLDRLEERDAVALALVGVLDRPTVPVDLELPVLAVTTGDRVVHHATGLPAQVQRLRRAVDHAEVQLAVGDDRLDRAEARVAVTADGAEEDQPAGVEAPPSLAGQLGGLRRELPPRRHGPTVERPAAPRTPWQYDRRCGSTTVMTAASLQDLRAAVVRDRVMEGVARLLAAGDDLTFAKVAAEAAVPERTVYRHHPTREALLAGVYAWANQRIGFEGQVPASSVEATALVRRVFPGFDEIAPVIRELLIAPDDAAGPPLVGGRAATGRARHGRRRGARPRLGDPAPPGRRRPADDHGRDLADPARLLGHGRRGGGRDRGAGHRPPRTGRPWAPPPPTDRSTVKELLMSPSRGRWWRPSAEVLPASGLAQRRPATAPPSTGRWTPVTKRACSEQRKATT